jgi:hypothetical protein
MSTAMVVVLAVVSPPAVMADTAGTPPNIIDYNRVPVSDWAAVGRIEEKAAREVLTTHSLPDSDYNAVRGWARNQVRTQLWADLVVIIKKSTTERTADEQAAYRWFQNLVHDTNLAAAQASVAEYIKYSGLTADTYVGNDPVNYNSERSVATGGYCVYRAPGPYVDEYKGWLDQTCYTASTAPLNFLYPMPSYDQFITYGQYQANRARFETSAFANVSFEVAASISVGASLALVGAALPIAFALSAGVSLGPTATAVATAVFPFAARAGTLATVALGAVASVVAMAVFFIVTVVLTSIQVDAQLRMGERLRDNLNAVANTMPDLRAQLLDDQASGAPRYYPGFFATFLQGTLPEATAEPCGSGLVISGGIYSPGCVNTPAPAAVVVDDPVFSVTEQGATSSLQHRSITIADPYHGGSALTRPSGKGWFVTTPSASANQKQSLALTYQGWDGRSYFAERIWDSTNGYRFAVTPVGDGGAASQASVTPTIQFTRPDGSKAAARIVASTVSSLTVDVPDAVNRNDVATFSATATGAGASGVSFTWYFPRSGTDPFLINPPAGIPSDYINVNGATVTRSFANPGLTDIFLAVSSTDGTYQLQRHTINVVDPRMEDILSVVDPGLVRLGVDKTLDVSATSGSPITLQLLTPDVCGYANWYTSPLVVRPRHAGTCIVNAISGGNEQYKPGQLKISFLISKAEQSISGGAVNAAALGETQEVVSTASSGLPVTISIAPQSSGICSASGNAVTAVALGTCYLLLTQAGSADYLPAPPQARSFLVNKSGQTIAFGPLADLAFGGSRQLTPTATSGLAVNLAVDQASKGVCSISGTTVTALALGTCSLTATQSGDGSYLQASSVTQSFHVVPAPLTITAADGTVVYGTTRTLGYTSSLPDVAVNGVACTAGVRPSVGAHAIVCSGGDAGANYTIDYVPGTLLVTPAAATVTVSPPTVQYSDQLPPLGSSWTASGLLPGDDLAGSVTGCIASALATSGGAVTSRAGSYQLANCSGLGNPNYDITYSGALTVGPEDVVIAYQGGWNFSTGTAGTTVATLAATVTQPADGSPGDLTLAKVDFLLFKSTNLGTDPDFSALGVAVDSSGNASTSITLPQDVYHLVVRPSPTNGFYAGLQASDELSVYEPVVGAAARGAGWVVDSDAAKDRAHFALSVRYNKRKQPQGQASVSWRNPSNGYDYVVRSTSWSGGGLAFQNSTASLSAKALLTVVNPATGAVVDSLSGGNYLIRMVANDGVDGASPDTLAVTVKDGSGATIHSIGVPRAMPIGGGNIIVNS